jgi:very-short-patch-repair endonuclease
MIRVREIPKGFFNLTQELDNFNKKHKGKKQQLGNYMKNQRTKNLIKHKELECGSFVSCVYINKQLKHTYVSKDIYDNFLTWISKTDSSFLYRKELFFAEVLNNSFKDVLDIEHQYFVNEYIVDFYIPKLNIVIEFDEPHHNQQIEKDKKREEDILKYLNCQIIRQKSNEPYELTINKIIKTLLK